MDGVEFSLEICGSISFEWKTVSFSNSWLHLFEPHPTLQKNVKEIINKTFTKKIETQLIDLVK